MQHGSRSLRYNWRTQAKATTKETVIKQHFANLLSADPLFLRCKCRPGSFSFAGRLMQWRSPLLPNPSLFYHQILIITISITLYDYLVPPERFSAISYPPTIGVTSCVSSTIIRVQLLVPKVFPAFNIDGIGFQRLRYHIDLHDCKVIGLRWLQRPTCCTIKRGGIS